MYHLQYSYAFSIIISMQFYCKYIEMSWCILCRPYLFLVCLLDGLLACQTLTQWWWLISASWGTTHLPSWISMGHVCRPYGYLVLQQSIFNFNSTAPFVRIYVEKAYYINLNCFQMYFNFICRLPTRKLFQFQSFSINYTLTIYNINAQII